MSTVNTPKNTKRDKRRARLQLKKAAEDVDDQFLDQEIAKNKETVVEQPILHTVDPHVADLPAAVRELPATPLDNYTAQKSQVPVQTASQELTIDELVKKLDTMWVAVKKHVKANPDFKDLDDKKKLDFFRVSFKTEMEEHPIVTRYMICLGQFRAKAFRKMLEKTKRMVHPPPEKREKGYMEDQWIRRQADYVQFLWEEYQRGHYNTAERKWVYQEAYNRLKGEFDDFRDMHKEVEKRVEEEKKSLAGRNVRDLLVRLKSGKQQLSDDEMTFLRHELRSVLIKSNFRVVLKQLKETRAEIEPVCVSQGQGEEVDERKKQITVIENGVLQPDQNVSDVPDAVGPKPVDYTGPVARVSSLESIPEQLTEYSVTCDVAVDDVKVPVDVAVPAAELRADNLE